MQLSFLQKSIFFILNFTMLNAEKFAINCSRVFIYTFLLVKFSDIWYASPLASILPRRCRCCTWEILFLSCFLKCALKVEMEKVNGFMVYWYYIVLLHIYGLFPLGEFYINLIGVLWIQLKNKFDLIYINDS